jgi:hypothetical protein
MKKRILLFSTLGVAAGFLYVLEANWRKQNGKEDASKRESKDSELSAKGLGQTTSLREGTKSKEAPRHAASMARIENGKAILAQEKAQPAIDDKGTDQIEASQILKNIRDNAFDASDEKLALALGRPREEIEQWTIGNGTIDGDVIMKARALALQRGLEGE